MLAETAGEIALMSWDKITFLGACLVVIVILWRLVGKLAGDKDGQSEKLIQFHKERADQAAAMAKSYADVVNANTTAMNALAAQIESSNELLKDLAHELEKRNG